MEKTADGRESEFLVILGSQADLSGASRLRTKAEKGRFVFETLFEHAARSQAGILKWLEDRRIEHRSFYIVNGILVKGAREVALELAGRPEVERIEGNPRLSGIRPLPAPFDERLQSAASGIESGVSYIRAPEVWAMGFTGQGIVIGGQDTGVRWDHPALIGQYRGYSEKGVDHDYNWHDSIHTKGGECGPDSKTPCDDDNHGTHTLGTAVGSDGGANQIGVAPGARFIACRNMDEGSGTPATYLECFQFFLAPYPVEGRPEQGDPSKAPDITTNSWTCPPSEGCEPETLAAAVKVQRAAGIMTVVAAGNAGAGCSTVVDPPAIYDDNYTIGALNASTGEIAGFSSRGPVTIDGSMIVKPDLTAPGVGVRSATRNGGYGSSSGTSMATPHAAGAVALLWSAFPDLRGRIELTENILNESAVRVEETECGSNGVPNNLYGYGRLDIKAAFDLASTVIESTSLVFGMRGGAGSLRVDARPGVAWRVRSRNDWITITSGSEGSGSGVVHFLIGANQSSSPRSGSLVIAGRIVTVSQAGFAPLYAVSGRAINDMGQPIARATIRFSRIAGGGDVPGQVETDEQGYWRQSGFEPGTTYRAEPIRSRIRFSPDWRDFSSPDNALNFSSVVRRIFIGSIR
ncbi:MAG: S8 family serine peptidase [Acidobacteriota bacterium]|nr:MAG: S8 family serine peptidase [Acidobacteriota bacterium]